MSAPAGQSKRVLLSESELCLLYGLGIAPALNIYPFCYGVVNIDEIGVPVVSSGQAY